MPDTSAAIQRLAETLDREQQCCSSLLTLLNREQEAVKTLSLGDLGTIHQEKITLLGELRASEDQRAEVVRRLAEAWGVEAETLALPEIAGRAGGAEADRLLSLQHGLNDAVTAVRQAGNSTSLILSGSLSFIERCLSLWRGGAPALSLYSQSGAMQSAVSGGALLARKG